MRFTVNKKIVIGIYVELIFILGIGLRFLWMAGVENQPVFDFAYYINLADSIAKGLGHTVNGIPVAWQGPAYPYLLGLLGRISGEANYQLAQILNFFLSVFTLRLMLLVYKRLFQERRACWLAAFTISALLPQYIAYVNVAGTEILFAFLLTLIIFVELHGKDKIGSVILIALLIGVGALTKPYMLIYPAVSGAVKWVTGKNGKASLGYLAVLFAGTALMATPWAMRNYRLFHRLIPVSYNSGYVMYINNNDFNINGNWMDLTQAAKGDRETEEALRQSLQDGRSVKEAHELEPVLKKRVGEWIKDNPLSFLKLGVLRLKLTFFSGANDIAQWAMNGYGFSIETQEAAALTRNFKFWESLFDVITYVLSSGGLIFLLAIFGKYVKAFFTKKTALDYRTGLVFTNILFFAALAFVFEGQARYAFPSMFFMIAALVDLVDKYLSADRSQPKHKDNVESAAP